MSFGVLDTRGSSAARLIPSRVKAELRGTDCKEPPAIPWTCWDKPGFKDCHAVAFKAAQEECEFRGLKDNACCINSITFAAAEEVCEKECPEIQAARNGGAMSTTQIALLVGAALLGLAMIGGKS